VHHPPRVTGDASASVYNSALTSSSTVPSLAASKQIHPHTSSRMTQHLATSQAKLQTSTHHLQSHCYSYTNPPTESSQSPTALSAITALHPPQEPPKLRDHHSCTALIGSPQLAAARRAKPYYRITTAANPPQLQDDHSQKSQAKPQDHHSFQHSATSTITQHPITSHLYHAGHIIVSIHPHHTSAGHNSGAKMLWRPCHPHKASCLAPASLVDHRFSWLIAHKLNLSCALS
jgi:hypothetical protein